jgi:hypothetical protein
MIRHIKIYALCCLLLAGSTAASGFGGGNGSASNPYLIVTPQDLDSVRNHLGDYFKLTQDIDLYDYIRVPNTIGRYGGAGVGDSLGWRPIGTAANPFTGHFDGDGHSIKGLWINRPLEDNVGLFGYTNGADIKQLGVEITTWKQVKGHNNVGALIGRMDGGQVYRCYSTGGISTWDGVDPHTCGLPANSATTWGGVFGNASVGGLVGYISGVTGTNFAQTYSSVDVGGRYVIGGLVGRTVNSTITNSYAVGNNAASIPESTSYADTVGGLVGYVNANSKLDKCFAAVHCIVNGAYRGSVAGVSSGTSNFTDCYYNNQLGASVGVGRYDIAETNLFVCGRDGSPAYSPVECSSTLTMVSQAGYPNFDFINVWRICEGHSYPHFAWQNSIPPAIIADDNNGSIKLRFTLLTPADTFSIFLGRTFDSSTEWQTMWSMCDSRGCQPAYNPKDAMKLWSFNDEPRIGQYWGFTSKYACASMPPSAPVGWLSPTPPEITITLPSNTTTDTIVYGDILPAMPPLTASGLADGDILRGNYLLYRINNNIVDYANPLPFNTTLDAGSYRVMADTFSITVEDKNGVDVGKYYNLPPQKINYGRLYVKKAPGKVDIDMSGYIGYGSPHPQSTSNSGATVTYSYKTCISSADYTTDLPNAKGCYNIKAVLKDTNNYTDAYSIINFTIPSMKPLEVAQADGYERCLDTPSVVFNVFAPNQPTFIYKDASNNTYTPPPAYGQTGNHTLYAEVIKGSDTIRDTVVFTVDYKKQGLLVISQRSIVYGDTLPPPLPIMNIGKGKITYYYKPTAAHDSVYDTTPPVDAGNYTVWGISEETCEYEFAQDHYTFSIAKAKGILAVAQDTGYYGYLPPPRVVSTNSDGAVSFAYKVRDASDNAYTRTIDPEVGSYTLRGIVEETNNYIGDTAVFNFLIVKARGHLVFTQADGYFNSALPAPVIISNNSGGAVSFLYKPALFPDAYYDAGIPANAGFFTIRGTLAETDNYTEGTTEWIFEIIDTICIRQPTFIALLYWEKLLTVNLNTGTNNVGYKFDNTSYLWTRNTQPIAQTVIPYIYLNHIPQVDDRYMVYAVTPHGDRVDTVLDCLLITEIPIQPYVKPKDAAWVYPNPIIANGQVTVETPDGSNPIEIYNVKGIKVKECPSAAPRTTVTLGGLPTGVYMVRQGGRTAAVVVQ